MYAVGESDERLGDPVHNDPQRLHSPSNARFFPAVVFQRYKRRAKHSKRVKNGFLSCKRACRLYSFLLSHCATLLAHALGLEAAPQPPNKLLLCASKRKGRGPGVLLAAFSFYWALDPPLEKTLRHTEAVSDVVRALPLPFPLILVFSLS